jgi:methanethiol S-methyltransferase
MSYRSSVCGLTKIFQTFAFTRSSKITRLAAFLYGPICYALFLVPYLYACGFVGNFVVSRSIDSTPTISWYNALLIDTALLVIFGIQHSVMARQGFKKWWTQFVAKPIERSTYYLDR